MPTYKLMYFNIRGLAETARWLFALAGQDYEDYRFKDGEWPTVKPNTPCGQAPILVVDGKQLSQSKAIFRYLGKQFGLIGKCDWDQARGDMIADYVDDVRAPLLAMHRAEDEAKKKELMEKYKENLPTFLCNFEKLLKENKGGDGYFVGDSVTWTDVSFVVNMNILKSAVGDDFLDSYPKLKALVQRVEALPAIAKWIKERPVTDH